MAKKSKIEYGLFARTISVTGMDVPDIQAYSKKRVFQMLEEEYPSTDGWEVMETNLAPELRGGNPVGYTLALFLRKVNE